MSSKSYKIPVILITNIGESSLSKMADCVLRICTRERAVFQDCYIYHRLDIQMGEMTGLQLAVRLKKPYSG